MKAKIATVCLVAGIVTVLISGCSTGVVSMGQNSYMIARYRIGFRDPSFIKAACLKEASDFCKKQGKVLRVTKTVETGLYSDVVKPTAEVYFACLDTNDPELKQPATIEEIMR